MSAVYVNRQKIDGREVGGEWKHSRMDDDDDGGEQVALGPRKLW